VVPLLLGVLRFLLVLIVVRLVGRFVAAAFRGYRGQVGGGAGSRLGSRELVRDPMCGTFVARDRALHARIDGRELHFCSAACRDAALAGRPALGHG
jgi:hypothetical protein